MKLTKEKTNTIIVKASTTDDYIYCDFAIIKLNKERLLDLYDRIKTMYNKKDGYGAYYSISCPFYLEFFVDNDEDYLEGIGEILLNLENDWSYIDITEEELDSLNVVEDYSQGTSLKMDYNGSFWFTGWGKHSGVNYETDIINVKHI